MAEAKKARAVGLNHVALEVGDIEEALAFYGRLFDFKLRGKSATRLSSIWATNSSRFRKAAGSRLTTGVISGLWSMTRKPCAKRWLTRGPDPLPGRFLDFLDRWGNRIEIVGYDNIQFTKAPNVLRGMGLSHLSKNEQAIKELTAKNMAPD